MRAVIPPGIGAFNMQNIKTKKIPRVYLKTDSPLGNPWIYSKMVKHPHPPLAAGTVVEVMDRSGTFRGRGFYHPSQTVAIRLLTEKFSDTIDSDFFFRRLESARDFREKDLGLLKNGNSYRLAHSEGDGLSGIIIDKFNDVLVIEAHNPGVFLAAEELVAALKRLYPGSRPAFRPGSQISPKELEGFRELFKKYPVPEFTAIEENGVKFQVNFRTGHKTGYFLDQRENHEVLAELASGKDLIDLFCYTGGFGVTALSRRARSVTCVDLDEKALATAAYNARLNGLPGEGQKLHFEHADAFDFLRKCAREKKTADIVVVDPSKLALVTAEISVAMKKYGDINRLAVQAVRPGGILLTCSCSGLISEETFLNIITRSAVEQGRVLQIFRISGAGPDHPVSSRFPQGRYLKAVFARVL